MAGYSVVKPSPSLPCIIFGNGMIGWKVMIDSDIVITTGPDWLASPSLKVQHENDNKRTEGTSARC